MDYITDEKKLTQHVREILGMLRIPVRVLIKPGTLPQPVPIHEETIVTTEHTTVVNHNHYNYWVQQI